MTPPDGACWVTFSTRQVGCCQLPPPRLPPYFLPRPNLILGSIVCLRDSISARDWKAPLLWSGAAFGMPLAWALTPIPLGCSKAYHVSDSAQKFAIMANKQISRGVSFCNLLTTSRHVVVPVCLQNYVTVFPDLNKKNQRKSYVLRCGSGRVALFRPSRVASARGRGAVRRRAVPSRVPGRPAPHLLLPASACGIDARPVCVCCSVQYLQVHTRHPVSGPLFQILRFPGGQHNPPSRGYWKVSGDLSNRSCQRPEVARHFRPKLAVG